MNNNIKIFLFFICCLAVRPSIYLSLCLSLRLTSMIAFGLIRFFFVNFSIRSENHFIGKRNARYALWVIHWRLLRISYVLRMFYAYLLQNIWLQFAISSFIRGDIWNVLNFYKFFLLYISESKYNMFWTNCRILILVVFFH